MALVRVGRDDKQAHVVYVVGIGTYILGWNLFFRSVDIYSIFEHFLQGNIPLKCRNETILFMCPPDRYLPLIK